MPARMLVGPDSSKPGGWTLMRRERRQTGSTRTTKPSKMDSLPSPAAAGFRPGPFPWDRYLQEVPKPSNRALRRSLAQKLGTGKRKD
jgi:hypothetical protein